MSLPRRKARSRPACAERLEQRQLLTAVALADASFETVAVASNSYVYNPIGSAWSFTSTAGIVNGSSSLDAPPAPNGSQAAFIQTDREASQYSGNGQDGSISQSVTLPASGYYTISFDAAADPNDTGGAVAAEESLMLTVDGTPVLTGLHPTSDAYAVVSGTFSASAGAHTLALVSTGPDSTTVFVDEVQLATVAAGPASQLVFSTVPMSLAAGVASKTMTVQMEDANGLLVAAPSGGVTVNLTTSSSGGLFLNSGGALTNGSVTIPAGASTVSFSYKDSIAGSPTITAAAAGLTAATQSESVQSVTSASFLRTSGTSIVNGRGQTVQLRGVNLGSWLIMEGWMSPLDSSGLGDEYGVIQTLDNRFGVAEEQSLISTYQQNWITTQDLVNIKNAGFNLVRVPVWWADFETLTGQWRSDAFTELDWLVNTAASMGIYTIIDMHGVVGGESTSDDTGQENLNDYWTSSYDQQQTDVLMQNIALHYANNPMVAGYDLMNEPMSAPSDSAVISAYKQLYSAVRAVDTNHIDIIEGCFDAWDWSMLPNPASEGWTDVVYEMHEYQWNDTSDPAGVEAGTNNQVTDFEDHASYDVPDYVGEFNDFSTGSSTWQYAFQQYDNNNISWSFWAYKAIDGTVGSQDSWGLYDPTRIPASPKIQTASMATIQSDWTKITTAGFFSINPLIANALQAAGVTPVPATLTGAALYLKLDPNGSDLDIWTNATGAGGYAEQLVLKQISTLTISVPTGALPSITLDNSDGDCIPEAGITVDGNQSTTLNVVGSGSGWADTVAVNPSSLMFDNSTVNFSGLSLLGFNPNGSEDALTLAGNAAVTLDAAPTGGGIAIREFSSLGLAAGADLAVATAASASDRSLLIVDSLAIAATNGTPTAKLDLGGNDMDVVAGNLSTLDEELESGMNAGGAGGVGLWTGQGIASSAAASTANRALGAILNSANGAALYGAGAPLGLFDGISPAPSDVLIRYTVYGDANLDGSVNAADYALIDDGFNRGLSGWYHGDFNYDGTINGDDYSLMDNSFNALAGAAAFAPSTLASPAAEVLASSTVAPASAADRLATSHAAPVLPTQNPATESAAAFDGIPAATSWADQVLDDASA